MKYDNIDSAVAAYIDFMVEDYRSFWSDISSERANEKVEEFRNNFEIRKGKKYIKLIADNSVKAFIVNVDNDKKFNYGDLLFCASFAAPARNSARGNVLEGKFSGGWTGPGYLK